MNISSSSVALRQQGATSMSVLLMEKAGRQQELQTLLLAVANGIPAAFRNLHKLKSF
jgi:hypothetical protein